MHGTMVLDSGGLMRLTPTVDFETCPLRRNRRTLVGPLDWAVSSRRTLAIVAAPRASRVAAHCAMARSISFGGACSVFKARLTSQNCVLGSGSVLGAERVRRRVRDLVSAGCLLGQCASATGRRLHRAIDMQESLGAGQPHIQNPRCRRAEERKQC